MVSKNKIKWPRNPRKNTKKLTIKFNSKKNENISRKAFIFLCSSVDSVAIIPVFIRLNPAIRYLQGLPDYNRHTHNPAACRASRSNFDFTSMKQPPSITFCW